MFVSARAGAARLPKLGRLTDETAPAVSCLRTFRKSRVADPPDDFVVFGTSVSSGRAAGPSIWRLVVGRRVGRSADRHRILSLPFKHSKIRTKQIEPKQDTVCNRFSSV